MSVGKFLSGGMLMNGLQKNKAQVVSRGLRASVLCGALTLMLSSASFPAFAQAAGDTNAIDYTKLLEQEAAATMPNTNVLQSPDTVQPQSIEQPAQNAQAAPQPVAPSNASLNEAAPIGVQDVGSVVPLGIPADAEMQTSDDPALGLQFKRVENIDNSMEPPSISDEEAALEQEEKDKQAFEKLRARAFDQTQNGMFPLRPEEITQMLRLFNTTREVGETAERPVPTPEVRVATISLDPSIPPEIIQTSPGYVTSLTILDVSGQPWPVQDVSWAGKFEVVPPEAKGHVIRITPMSAHGMGNMSIRLIGLSTPVTFSLATGTDKVHFRFDARMPEYGPNANIPIIGGSSIVAGDALLTAILDGTPPPEARKLQVSGVDGRTSVWKVNNGIYVRTPFTLLSPGWKQSANSSDGMKVYSIGGAPVLLLSDGGNMVRASIGKEEIVDGE